jgi:uncharacterized protein YneF (UPF0154 family)
LSAKTELDTQIICIHVIIILGRFFMKKQIRKFIKENMQSNSEPFNLRMPKELKNIY